MVLAICRGSMVSHDVIQATRVPQSPEKRGLIKRVIAKVQLWPKTLNPACMWLQ